MNREILVLRDAIVKLTQLLTGMGLTVTQRGTSAYVQVDPKTQKPVLINIPHIPDDADQALLQAIQGFVDHEVAHVLFTNWDVVRKSNARGEKFNNLRNLLEDTFIEREMGKKFPGSAYNIQRLHQFFIDRITKPALASRGVAGDPNAQFVVLLVPLIRALAGQPHFQAFIKPYLSQPIVKQFLEAMPKDAIDRIPKIRHTQDSYDLAEVIYNVIHPPKSGGSGESEESSPSKSKPSTPKPEPKAPPAKPSDDDREDDEQDDEEQEEQDDAPGSSASSKPEEGDGDNDDQDDDADEEQERPASGVDDEDDGADSDGADEDDDADSGDDGEDDGADDDADGDADDEKDGGADDADDDHDDGDGAAADGDQSDDDDPDVDEKGSLGGDDSNGEGARSEHDDSADEQDSPDHVDHEEGDQDEEGDGNAKPDAFSTGDFPAVTDFSKEISDRIAEDTSKALSASDYRIWTRDFDKIERFTPSSYDDAWLTKLDDETRSMVGLMQKEIERLMAARSQVVHVPGYRSGRLNSSGLHRLIAGDDRVFRRKHEARSKDTVVGLLIDNSGSMAEYNKIRVAMSSGYALSQTLERVGIKHEVLGFTTEFTGYAAGSSMSLAQVEERRMGVRFSRVEPIYMPIYKDFDERLTPDVKKRFAAAAMNARHMRNNIDGECVEIAIQRLARRPEKRKVLMVLSDGQPYAMGQLTEQYGKLHSVVAEAPKFGVELIGLGIMDSSVRGYYPRSMVLSSLTDLPKAVMNELRGILLAA